MPSHCKRPREHSATATAVAKAEVPRIVRALNLAVSSASRLEALQGLFRYVAHDPETRTCTHPQYLDHLVEGGAVHALCLQLGFVLNKRDPCLEDMVCRAIGMLYQCSSVTREASLKEIGSELCRLLQRAVDLGSEVITREVMVTWHACAETDFGSHLLLSQSGFLGMVVSGVQGRVDSGDIQSEALGILKHVTYFGEDHRLRILEEPGLMSSLTRIPFECRSNKVMERLSAVFRNLALSPNTRLVMANQADLLTGLLRLASDFNRRTTRNVTSTWNSLILETECCFVMLTHGDGILLNVLTRLIAVDYEDDEVVRRRSARILRFMARDSCVSLMICHEELMQSLSSCALSDPCHEVRLEAAEAFAKCAAVIHAPMSQHVVVLESLTHLADQSTTVLELVARVFNEQAGKPTNRSIMASHEGLLEALATSATSKLSSLQAKKDAISAMYYLSLERTNLERMAISPVLSSLVTIATDYHLQGTDTMILRDNSVNTLLNLISVPCNRKAIATQQGLLQLFVHYAASTGDASVKSTIKQALLWLVPLL